MRRRVGEKRLQAALEARKKAPARFEAAFGVTYRGAAGGRWQVIHAGGSIRNSSRGPFMRTRIRDAGAAHEGYGEHKIDPTVF